MNGKENIILLSDLEMVFNTLVVSSVVDKWMTESIKSITLINLESLYTGD